MPKLSREHLLRIGELVVECAALETAMADAIWQLLLIGPEDGLLLIRRMDVRGKVDVLRAMGVNNLNDSLIQDEFFDLLRVIEAQLAEREFIVHASWSDKRWGFMMASGRTPTSFRSESCGPEWLIAVTQQVRVSTKRLDVLLTQMLRNCRAREAKRLADLPPPPSLRSAPPP